MLLTVTSFLGQLVLEARHLLGEPLRQRPDGLVLRFLDQLPLVRHDLFDDMEQGGFRLRAQRQPFADPLAQVGRSPRVVPVRDEEAPMSSEG
jgi:hypothetical protein